jgi:hypothetical protein
MGHGLADTGVGPHGGADEEPVAGVGEQGLAGDELVRGAGEAGPHPQLGRPDGVDLSDPEAIGPAELRVWTRFPGAPDDPAISQALLAYASDGFLIGTAMRPHAGVGQSMAHVSISTTVLTQTLSFHEQFSAADWLLLDQRSSWAGRGRSQGAGTVFTADGRLVASFTQVNMVRDFPAGQAPPAGQTSAH